MKATFLFLFLVFSALSLEAQNGHSVFGFLDFPVSSHANALGGENISIVGSDLSMVAHNPALLGPEMHNQLALHYTHYLKSINAAGFQYARAIRDKGAWALGLRYLDYGSFTQTTPDNTVVGTFGAKDLSIDGTIGYDIADRWRGGATAKLLYSSYEQYTSVALAVDLGVNYFNPNNTASFSMVLRNLGGQIKTFEDTRESLPLDLQIGYSQFLAHAPFRFSITAYNLLKWNTDFIDDAVSENEQGNQKKSNFAKDLFRHLTFGIDYIPTDHFYVALGYNYKRQVDFKDGGGFLPGFSAGAGLQIRMFDIQASVARHHRSGTSLMLGVNLLIDKF